MLLPPYVVWVVCVDFSKDDEWEMNYQRVPSYLLGTFLLAGSVNRHKKGWKEKFIGNSSAYVRVLGVQTGKWWARKCPERQP
jgi:hypothetical protein